MKTKEEIREEFREFTKQVLDKGLYKTKYIQKEYRETYALICDIEDFWFLKLSLQKQEIVEEIKKEHKHNFQFIQKEIWKNGYSETDGIVHALFMCECGEKKRIKI